MIPYGSLLIILYPQQKQAVKVVQTSNGSSQRQREIDSERERMAQLVSTQCRRASSCLVISSALMP